MSRRTILALLATLAVLGPLAYFWQDSLLPGTYSVADMGYVDDGRGGPPHPMGHVDGGLHGGLHGGHSVDSLTEPGDAPPDVAVTLVARAERFRLGDGREVDGYTLNGTSPGPTISATQGQLVAVTLVNESVPDGVALHWHGVDVPNAVDGVAGVTQDAVGIGQRHLYRFRVRQSGTYWYHSHQVSHEQVQRGLLGALVVTPAGGLGGVLDVPALVHLYPGAATVNGRPGDVPVPAPPGARVRVRVINTDNGLVSVWTSGAPYRLVAVDGTDLNDPAPVADTLTLVPAGGRGDLEIEMPADGRGVRVELGGAAALVLGTGPVTPSPLPRRTLDLLSYGTPAPEPLATATPDRTFDYAIGRRPGFLDGLPGYWWTINGHMFPDVPMFLVAEGDVVRMRISNSSGQTHPMHLHGHHALVLSRNGVAATGGPWWVDSLEVEDGATYEIAFRADNPGLWMDHCHNLPHASEGLVTHLMYEGVTTPYRVGGAPANQPE